jgi:hypothetical protein
MSVSDAKNYPYLIYLEMCDKMIESIVSNIDYNDFEKNVEIQYEERWKKTAMKSFLEQLKTFLRKELRVG